MEQQAGSGWQTGLMSNNYYQSEVITVGLGQKILTVEGGSLVSYELQGNMMPKVTNYRILATSIAKDLVSDMYVVGYTNQEYRSGKLNLVSGVSSTETYYGDSGGLSQLGERVWMGLDKDIR